jgi:uncharacterized phage protein gp47/JayE
VWVPWERPSLATLVERVRSDFRGRLAIASLPLRRAMADIFSAVWAGAVHTVHGSHAWLAEQIFPDTAERQYMLQWGAIFQIFPTAATFATGTVDVTGGPTGVVPEDTILVHEDGMRYRVTAEVTLTLSGGDYRGTLDVIALESGSGSNLEVGTPLTLESPIADVDSEGEVISITGGFDTEETEGTRDRVLLRFREPPTGGSDQDYEAWALAVAGVTRAWVFRHENGLGTVVVRFVMDEEVDIFPDAGQVALVQTAIDAERPTTAEVTVEAPVELPVDLTIELTPDNADTRAAVEAELEDLFTRLAAPGDGVTSQGVILLSKIRTAIDTAAGVEDYDLTVPAADVTPALGELATLGTITWA